MHDPDLPPEAHNKMPKGYLLFFIALAVFIPWYVISYTPAISGWSFYTIHAKEMKEAEKVAATATANPGKYVGKPAAIAEGKTEYETNCAACHMADASGGIGPNLKTGLKYGAAAEALYESIASGRPNGMPPFKQQLGNEKIYKIIAFIESVRD